MHCGAFDAREEQIVGEQERREGRYRHRGGRAGHERVLLMMLLGASHFINYTQAAALIEQGDEQALAVLSGGETNFIYC